MRKQSEGMFFVGQDGMEELRIVLFSVFGVKMGVLAGQIAGMLSTDMASRSYPRVRALHELIPFGGKGGAYLAPKALLLKNRNGLDAVVVDNPEDIVVIRLKMIRPLPVLLETGLRTRAIWGVVVRGEEIVLLIDFSVIVPDSGVADLEESSSYHRSQDSI